MTVGIFLGDKSAVTTGIEVGTGDLGLIHNLGSMLYSEYVLPFELSSILFISAMIGAVMLSKKDEELLD